MERQTRDRWNRAHAQMDEEPDEGTTGADREQRRRECQRSIDGRQRDGWRLQSPRRSSSDAAQAPSYELASIMASVLHSERSCASSAHRRSLI